MREIVASAPGKINLLLRSGKVGDDGYHPLVTVFEAISLREYVVARTRRSPGVTVETSVYWPAGDPATNDEPVFDGPRTRRFQTVRDQNHLAVQAAKMLQPLAAATSWGSTSSGVHLHVHKTIPVGGGMAGGSADAAATLVALNEMWGLSLSEEQLLAVGARLGADVPACLLGGQSVGTRRGDQVAPLPAPPGLVHWWALAFDQKGLPTPAVFEEFDRLGLGRQAVSAQEIDGNALTGPAGDLTESLENDLQVAAESLRPALRQRGEAAVKAGARAWLVSGSGPTVAALTQNRAEAESICAQWSQQPGVAGVAVVHGPVSGARVDQRLPGWARP